MAFYNCDALANIDLSKVKSLGDYAFSGDVYYICLDDAMAYAAVSPEGQYMYTYHAPNITMADLSSAESIGEYAFAYCQQMTDVVLNPAITEIKQYTFANCDALANIDLSHVVTIGDYAFMESKVLAAVDLSAAETVGKYAFVNAQALTGVTFNPNGTTLDEGAFAYCKTLTAAENMNTLTSIGDYAFTYAGIVDADLSGAEHIGAHAFMKEEVTPFTVKLGENLKTLGDNPFAMCQVTPLGVTEVTTFNGVDYTEENYTYDISDTVYVINGSLYAEVPSGLELITYAGVDGRDMKVADNTVRITALAFAGSDVERVTLPYTTTSIGHKAFYGCDNLEYVVFNSYDAPILEEEFDSTYYETYDHVPGTGSFGTYTDYEGNEVEINGFGLLPYFMWNATGGQYSNIFYGANFVDYVGFVEQKLTMVRPANGQNYDSFIMDQYFDLEIMGANAADDTTLAAIKAINAIPERVAFTDKDIVDAARAAYSKIATIEQQALVTNYGTLVSAEQRIIALDPANQETEEPVDQEEPKKSGNGWVVAVVIAVVAAAAAAVVVLKGKKTEAQTVIQEESFEFLGEVVEQEPREVLEESDFQIQGEEADEAAEETLEETAPEAAEPAPEKKGFNFKSLFAKREKRVKPQLNLSEEAPAEEMPAVEAAEEVPEEAPSEAEEKTEE